METMMIMMDIDRKRRRRRTRCCGTKRPEKSQHLLSRAPVHGRRRYGCGRTRRSMILLHLAVLTVTTCHSQQQGSVTAFVMPQAPKVRLSYRPHFQMETGAKTIKSKKRRRLQLANHDDEFEWIATSKNRSTTTRNPPPGTGSGKIPTMTKTNSMTSFFLSVLLSVSLAVFSGPQAAHAGFGPSSGATTTPPPGLTRPSVQDAESLSGKSGKKLKILIGSSLDERRLREFNAQLDAIIEALKDRNENGGGVELSLSSSSGAINENGDGVSVLNNGDEQQQQQQQQQQRKSGFLTSEELERALLIQTQIQERERLLDKLEAQPYWFNYLAAFIGSIASTLVMHPVDTVKTRLMLQGATSSSSANVTDAVDEDVDDETVDTADGKGGEENNAFSLSGLYEGLTGNLWKEGPPSALYLGVYETVKSSLVPRADPSYLLLVYLLAGAAGEMVGSVVRAPAEAVKSLVQSKSSSSSSALEAARRVLGTPEGRQNVVRAWSASIGRDVPFGAIQLAAFEVIKASILNNPNIDFDSSTLQAEAIIGAFAGGLGAFLTTPADVITTRIITQSTATSPEPVHLEPFVSTVHNETEMEVYGSIGDYKHVLAVELASNGSATAVLIPSNAATAATMTTSGHGGGDDHDPSHHDVESTQLVPPPPPSQPLGVVGMAKKIYEEEGAAAFFTGWSARVGYWAPAISIFLTVYCSVRQAGIKLDLFHSQ